MLDWNLLVYASLRNDISSLSFWKTERLPCKHIPIDFINENCNFSLDPRDCYIVVGFSFLANHFCEAWIKFLTFTAHSSCRRHYHRCETSMLDLKNVFVICFLFLFFIDFISFGEFYVCISFCVWVEPSHLKMPSDLLARTHEHWYQVWLHYQLQLNVEDIHPLIVEAAVPHAHLYKLLLTVST